MGHVKCPKERHRMALEIGLDGEAMGEAEERRRESLVRQTRRSPRAFLPPAPEADELVPRNPNEKLATLVLRMDRGMIRLTPIGTGAPAARGKITARRGDLRPRRIEGGGVPAVTLPGFPTGLARESAWIGIV